MILAQLNGAKTVGFYTENTAFSSSLISGSRAELESFGMREVANFVVTAAAPTDADYKAAIALFKRTNPDIIIGGTTRTSCSGVMKQFSEQNWLPKGGLFSLCASDSKVKEIAPNSPYFVDYVEWDRKLTGAEYTDKYYFPPTNQRDYFA